jgi:hypothetical protein
MERYLSSHRIKILALLLAVIFIGASIIVWQKYPFEVKQYKTIKLGMEAAEKAGDSTGWAPPDDQVYEGADFYVYSLGDENMCIGSSRGVGGYFSGVS